MKTVAKEFSRYLLVGGTAFAVDFGTLVLMTDAVGLHYLLSATLGFLVGTVVNYLLSTRWVFSLRAVSNPVNEFLLFAAIGAAGIILNGCIIAFSVELLGTSYILGKTAAAGMILFFNFGMRKWLLFSNFFLHIRAPALVVPAPNRSEKRAT